MGRRFCLASGHPGDTDGANLGTHVDEQGPTITIQSHPNNPYPNVLIYLKIFFTAYLKRL